MQPIDLQTLFTQMDKVGKLQTLQREGLQFQQALQHVESQRKAEEQVRSVNEAQNMGEGAEKIKDDDEKQQQQNSRHGEERNESAEEENGRPIIDPGLIRDYRLGQNIDISG